MGIIRWEEGYFGKENVVGLVALSESDLDQVGYNETLEKDPPTGWPTNHISGSPVSTIYIGSWRVLLTRERIFSEADSIS